MNLISNLSIHVCRHTQNLTAVLRFVLFKGNDIEIQIVQTSPVCLAVKLEKYSRLTLKCNNYEMLRQMKETISKIYMYYLGSQQYLVY